METDDSDEDSTGSNGNKDAKGDPAKSKRTKKSKKGKQTDYKWIVTAFFMSFVITIALSVLSNKLLKDIELTTAILILIFFISLGVIFDIAGLAIATADEKQFHSMAARKINSAKCAIKLIRNAEKVSSFCNDVIGDIAGIISGATGAAIIVSLYADSEYGFAANLIITALIAACTVGSKAFGKTVAMNNNNAIVNLVSKIIYFFQIFPRGFRKKDDKK